MLSKQQKQRYGQVLRQQMKQKQQRKKNQGYQKRGQNNKISPQYNQQPKEQIYYQPPITQKQNPINLRPLVDPKQQLQKKFQGPEYNYFGSLGGGNPIRRDQPNRNNGSMPTGLRIQPEELMQYSNNRNQNQGYPQMVSQQQRGLGRMATQQQERNYYQNQLESISPPTNNYPGQRASTNQNNYYPQNPLASNRINYNPYQQQGSMPQSYGTRDIQQPISFDYIPGTNSRLQQQQYSYPNGLMNPYQQNINMPQQNMNAPPSLQPQQRQMYQPVQQQQQMMSPQQTNNKDSQQLMQVYRKGGRNLLKLQNQTVDEHMIKQKRKQQIQKQLKQQIQEAQKRKKQQKQKIQRQQQQDQRKQLAYIAEQKRKNQQQQRKQKNQRQKIIDQNVKNLQRKKQFQQQAKQKVNRQQQQRRQKQNKKAQYQRNKIQQQRNQQIKKNQKAAVNYASQQSYAPRNKLSMNDDDNNSVVSSQISSLQKGYSTNLPKQFFMKERQRINPMNNNKKFESLTYEVQKMQDQIRKQGQIFNKQMYKVKQDAQKALIQKRKAQQQIQRLKKQLKRKMDQDNQKLLKALQTNDYRNQYGLPPQQSNNNYGYNQNQNQNQNQYNNQNQQHYKNSNKNNKNYEAYQQQQQRGYHNSGPKKPLRQKQSQKLIRQDYQPSKYNLREQQSQNLNQSIAGLVSLDGDSKHIPMNLPNAQNLTISQVQNFAKDSSYFQKGTFNKNSPQKMQKFNSKIHEHESIPEQQNQQREYGVSRKSNRNIKSSKQIIQSKDQLDRLMDSRAKSRGGWGQMSSVNSDITKQIQELLKNKGLTNQKNNQRPSSISNAGKQSLARQGYAYDGLTLNSNVGTLNQGGTLDIDRINGRNDARLKQLRNLGVQTINTNNGDDDLERLDKLLNKYK